MLAKHLVGDLYALLEALRPRRGSLAAQHLGEGAVDVAIEDRLLVIAVLREPLDLLALDRHRALVLLHAVAVEDAHFDDRTKGSRRHAERRVAHVRRFLAEDGAEQLF